MSFLILFLLSLINSAYFILIGITDTTYLLFSFLNMSITFGVIFSNERQPFTLTKMVNLFVYIFFILANAVQFSNNTNVLSFHLRFSDSDFSNFQILTFAILVLYNTTYHYIYKKKISKGFGKIYNRNSFTHNDKIKTNYNKLIVISIISSVFVWAYNGFNPMNMLFRGYASNYISEQVSDGTMNLIVQQFIRPIPFASFLICMLGDAPKKARIFIFILMLVTVFPTGIARNAAAMYWIPVIILLFSRYLRHNLFMWLMMIAIFIIFPFINVFRNRKFNLDLSLSMELFDNMNFDASQIFMATIKTDFVTYGYQILGSLFFYIPRSLWPSKPIGSGHALVTLHDGWWPNVSMPFFSEGFVNFGWIGIFLFTIALAYICGKLDKIYWSQWFFDHDFKTGYYLILLGASFFLLRGDLLSSTAYTVGIMLSYTFVLVYSTKKRRISYAI